MPRVAILTSGGIAPCLSASIGGLIEIYNDISSDSDINSLNELGVNGVIIGKAFYIWMYWNPSSTHSILDRAGTSIE